MKTKKRSISVFVAVSPIHEGANIYLSANCHAFFESFEDALKAGWEKYEIVKAKITYTKKEGK